eukprot:5890784-Prymnesium_polylepis.1
MSRASTTGYGWTASALSPSARPMPSATTWAAFWSTLRPGRASTGWATSRRSGCLLSACAR